MNTSAMKTSSFILATSLGPKSGRRTSTCLSLTKFSELGGLKWKSNMPKATKLDNSMLMTEDHGNLAKTKFSKKQYVTFEITLKHPSEHTVGRKFGSGSYLPNSAIFRQHFSIRAYEIGATGKISFETLMNLLQETGINSVKGMGLEVDMRGSTPEMRKQNLVWVATKVQVVIDSYSCCGDVVQVDNLSVLEGKNCMRRDAIIRDCKTGEILVRTSSIWMTMNTKTRKVGRIPDEVRAEVGSYLVDAPPAVEDDNKQPGKLEEATAAYICSDLKPRQSDLDCNQYVHTSKYIGWIFESVPMLLLENHELSRITMEYIRECHKDNMLKSLTTVSDCTTKWSVIECSHLLKLENGAEIMKARSEWRPKQAMIL